MKIITKAAISYACDYAEIIGVYIKHTRIPTKDAYLV